eukprot:scaffold42685_cov281-Isochrysis_galbana.AAC.3
MFVLKNSSGSESREIPRGCFPSPPNWAVGVTVRRAVAVAGRKNGAAVNCSERAPSTKRNAASAVRSR